MYLNAAAVHVLAETWVRARVCVGFFVLISVSLVFFFNNFTEIWCVDLKLAKLFAGVTE